jgi:hypothetical protein
VPHSGHHIILVYGWSAIEGTFVLIAGVGYGRLTEAVEPEGHLGLQNLYE